MARKGIAAYMGHDKEPPQPHGPRQGGRTPSVHSHSARPKRRIKTSGKRGGRAL
jgi:hypothetical protein